MKRIYLLVILIVFTTLQMASAQAPQGIPYQAVARDNAGNLVKNQAIALRFSVHDSSSNGTLVYAETHSITTDALGLFSVNIGGGTTSTGTFANISWGNGNKFTQVELDIAGGSNYTDMGTMQMLSVPYALYAAKSGDASTTWSQNGNAGTDEYAHFIGTTDNVPFSIRVNNQPAAYIGNDITNNSTFLGYQAGNFGSGYNLSSTAIGYMALYSNSGKQNTAIGNNALYSNITGGDNSAIGANALYKNTYGYNNTANGTNALANNTTGNYNSANGNNALIFNTTGNYNTANGFKSLRSNTTGNFNTAIGISALFNNITGNGNVAIGDSSLYTNSIGAQNTALGNNADVVTNALTNATAIGFGAKVNASNKIQLGNTSITNVNTNGTYTAGAVTYPNTDGAAGQVLSTTGAGTLTWVSPQSGPTGPQGATGITGPQGPQGLTGATGSVSDVGTVSAFSTANGASIVSGVLSLAPANATNGGIVTSGTQIIGGNKTFIGTTTASSFVKTDGTSSQYLMADGSTSNGQADAIAAMQAQIAAMQAEITEIKTPTVTPIIESYIYTGSAQGPTKATNTGTGTSYTFIYQGVSPTIYAASATPPANPGSYTVTVTVAASGIFISASSAPTVFTISPIVPIVPIVTPIVTSYSYTGSEQGPTTATNTGTGTSYTFSYVGVSPTIYAASAIGPKNVGNYTVTVTVAANDNFTSATSAPTAFSIALATPTVTANAEDFIFTGTAQGPTTATNTGTGTSYTYSYAGVSPTVYAASAAPPTNEGIYTVTVTVAANGNYTSATSAPKVFRIYIPDVTIGTQKWTTTNLDVTTYRDGTPIPQVTDPTAWENLTTGAWCYYDNYPVNGPAYGKLYNWYAVAGIHDNDPSTPNKILAPTGWHVPSDAEWTTLTTFLGGYSIAGGNMKETGFAHWDDPNRAATNLSGFTGLPGGYRYSVGSFYNVFISGYWWSSTVYPSYWDSGSFSYVPESAKYIFLDYTNGEALTINKHKASGFSVRCLRD